MHFKVRRGFYFKLLQYKTVYKKIVHTRNVTVTLNLTDSLNTTESNLTVNFGTVLHTVQVNGHYCVLRSSCTRRYDKPGYGFPSNRRRWKKQFLCLVPLVE